MQTQTATYVPGQPFGGHAAASTEGASLLPAAGQPPFRFQFKKRYDGLFTNQHEKFVLREEHVAALRRVVRERNRHGNKANPLSMSDIVNASLDFLFEHPVVLEHVGNPEEVREALAKEVYRRAFVHFVRLHEMF